MAQLIGEYELLEVLGKGTVGSAYRARHTTTGKIAAVKLLQQHAATEPEIQRRFVREVAICEKLNHPNVVRHFDCGLHEGQIFFAMELVDCGSLKEVLQKSHVLPWREVAECGIQVAAALQYAHEQGIIHRDLKPANLFLAEDGKIKVGDFGLARDLHNSRLTMEGQTVGTCRYMPPEQIMGKDDLSGAVDVYALGCILFEMLTGRTPFGGETVVQIFEQHINSKPPNLTKLVPGCPEDLASLIEMMLAKEPDDRPQCAAIQAALTDILHDRPMQLETRTHETIAADVAAAADPEKPNLTVRLQTVTGGQKLQMSPRKIAILVFVVGIVIVAGILISQMR